MTTSNHVYIIDGNAYIHRAYHAIAPLSNKNGVPTNATYGFVNILQRVLREKSPQYIAIAFDAKGPNFRHELYSEYKSNRPPMAEDLAVQIPYIKQIVQAHNILTMEQTGLEADDLIAAAATRLADSGNQVIIVSGDKDLLQLVSDNITIWEPMKNIIFDPAAVHKKYNVSATQLTDLFSMMGDKSDNIPGVPGIGPKTAEKLINEFGSLDDIFNSLEKIKRVKLRDNLATHKESAFLSKSLIKLKTDVEVPDSKEMFRIQPPDQESLTTLYSDLEFSRLLQNTKPSKSLDSTNFHLIQTEEELHELIATFSNADFLAVDTETTSLNPLTADLVGISLSCSKDSSYYLPLSHFDSKGHKIKNQLSLEATLALIRKPIEDSKLPLIGHNLKYDLAILDKYGITPQGPLWDTMIASYLIDPGKRSHKLDTLCTEMGLKTTSFQEVTQNAKSEDCFRYVSLEKAKDYSCEDVAAAILLWEKLSPILKKNKLSVLFEEVETPLVPVLAEMEKNGIKVNQPLLENLSIEFDTKLQELAKAIFALAGKEFNINSPKQLAQILFEELKLPHGRKTKTGYSTDSKVLEKLALKYKLPKLIIEHRNLTKLKSTYIDKLAGLIHPKTNRIHTSFNQTVTTTGRLSSSNPNLQNIPIRTPEGQRIREAFIPEQGNLFIAADYSQIDLRVLAHYSKDEALVNAFQSGEDIHKQTAGEIFRVNHAFVTSQMRRVAKSINFGIVYGMSAFGLASQLNISRKEAALFIERYFAHYKGVRQFMEEIVAQAKDDGFITTLMGRRRYLPDINSPNKTRREFAERTALNTPIQGTAADIIKIASLKVDKQLKSQHLKAKILLQIHDELILEAPESEKEACCCLVKKAMEEAFPLAVPLTVNITTGYNLAKT